MRYFAIGDIHGHFDELCALYDKIEQETNFNLREDHLILLGDLVDNGPKTREVIDWCMATQAIYPKTFHPLKGNHDDMCVDALKYGCKRYSPGAWYTQGGEETLKSYGIDTQNIDGEKKVEVEIPKEHIEFLENLPLFYETEEYFFVHGGVPPISLSEVHKMLAAKDPEIVDGNNGLMWIRATFYNSSFDWGKKIIFAHTPFEKFSSVGHSTWEPFEKENMIGINTMPRNDGKLTAIELPGEKFYFQPKI